MDIDKFFYRLYALAEDGEESFVGSAFPVTPDGGLLTCRHVASVDDARQLLVHDNETGRKHEVGKPTYPALKGIDLAFLPEALPGNGRSFLPVLSPHILRIGEKVYSYGFFVLSSGRTIEQGYFAGNIVNFTKDTARQPPIWSLTLPYPVIEGMSGSPVLTYHNGPKVVGLGYGNRSTRILASEVLEYEDDGGRYEERVHRITEFGLAYHCDELVRFLREAGAGGVVVSDQSVPMEGI